MLAVDSLTKAFNGVRVLREVSLKADPGVITGVVGPNGSGKSTLFDLISGVVPADSGSVVLNDVPIALSGPRNVAQQGIGRTFQVPRILREMTVIENVMLVSRNFGDENFGRLFNPFAVARLRDDRDARLAKSIEMLKAVGLVHLANQPAGVLSGGQSKLLSAAMLLVFDPPCLLLDEPMSGVNTVGIDILMGLLEDRNKRGLVTVVVEHNLAVISVLCARVFVLHGGQVIASGSPEVLRQDPLVRDAYVGRSMTAS